MGDCHELGLVGIALSWSDNIFTNGYRQSVSIEAFRNGHITLSQLAKNLNISKKIALELIGKLRIEYIDYNSVESLEKELDRVMQ